MRALIAIAAACGVGCMDPEVPPTTLPPDRPDVDPGTAGELVVPVTDATEVATDRTHLYWLATTGRGGRIVRLDLETRDIDIIVDAIDADAQPAELHVTDHHVYWTELRGWASNGSRTLGMDRLVRVPKEEAATPLIISETLSLDPFDHAIASAGGDVYWLNPASPFDKNGVLYRMPDEGPLVVETVASDLDQPRILATDGTRACFRTGHPNELSPIECVPVAGGARTIAAPSAFPYEIAFIDGALVWADGHFRAILRIDTGVRDVAYAERPLRLVGDRRGLYWLDDAGTRGIRLQAGITGADHVTTPMTDEPGLALALTPDHVYVTSSRGILRAAR